MSYFAVSDFFDENREVCISDEGWKNLIKLAEIVSNTHFSYLPVIDREDLRSVGIVKAVELLNKKQFDFERSLKNYVYTGMRNEMRNYLYRQSKEFAVEDTMMVNVRADEPISKEQWESLRIDDEVIKSALGRLYTPLKAEMVKATMRVMGFDVVDEGEFKVYREVAREVSLVVWMKKRI